MNISLSKHFAQPFLRFAEIDEAIAYGVLSRVVQMAMGLVSVFLLARFLSPVLQGYYYTFGSLIALQTFVELSLYLVVTNRASHEWGYLKLDSEGRITGDPAALSRLVSLGRSVFKWYAVAAFVFVSVIGSIGYLFLSQRGASVTWKGPWVAQVLLSGVLLWMLPFNALLEGCNQVVNIQKLRLGQALLGNLALWVILYLGGGLWAAVALTAVAVARDLYLLLFQYQRFFVPFFTESEGPRINWKTEIWPMQWRLGISGLVNYFAFSIFTPVMFQFHGPVAAGQMGMTWTLVTAVQSIPQLWLQTRISRFGSLIARREFDELDRFWKKTSVASLSVAFAGAAAALGAVVLLNVSGSALSNRLLPPLPTALLLAGAVLMQISQCQSAYLRAHLQEPLAVLSIVSSLSIGGLVIILGRIIGPLGAALAYLLVVAVITLPWQTVIWRRCRTEWHKS
jgi:hypothetical protein